MSAVNGRLLPTSYMTNSDYHTRRIGRIGQPGRQWEMRVDGRYRFCLSPHKTFQSDFLFCPRNMLYFCKQKTKNNKPFKKYNYGTYHQLSTP